MKKLLAIALGVVMVLGMNSTTNVHAEEEVYDTLYLYGGGGVGRGCGSNVDLDITTFIPWMKSGAMILSEDVFFSKDYNKKLENNLLTEDFTVVIEQYIDGKYIRNAPVEFVRQLVGVDTSDSLKFTEDFNYCDIFEENAPKEFMSYFNENFDSLLAHQKRRKEVEELLKGTITEDEKAALEEEHKNAMDGYSEIYGTLINLSHNATTVKFIVNDGKGNEWISDHITIASFFRGGGSSNVVLSLVKNEEESIEEEKPVEEKPQEEVKPIEETTPEETKPETAEEIVKSEQEVVSEKIVVKESTSDNKKETPNTGIMNNGGLYMILGLGSIVAITVLLRKKKKTI